MLKNCALAVGLLLLATVPCLAQSGDYQSSTGYDDPYNLENYRFWVRLEYLLWQLQAAPLPSALLTTGGPVNLGVVGASDTTTIYGGSQDYGWMSGARLAAGIWFDYENRVGMEGAFFLFGARSEYANFSAPAGSVLSLPFNTVVNNVPTPTVFSLANPGASPQTSATASFENDVRFLGGNLDFVFVPYRSSWFEFNFLVGFNSVFLKEDSTANYSSTSTSVSSNAGTTTTSTTTNQASDSFSTQNLFYGGELGVRGIFHYSPFFLEATGRLALGVNTQVVDITGQSSSTTTNVSVGAAPGTTVSTATAGTGFLAQASNIGSYNRTTLCVMPQFQVRVGVDLTSNIRFSVGYDVLYLTSVVRPGNQMDQIMGTLNGVTHPAFSFNSSSFYAQGVNVGLEFRF